MTRPGPSDPHAERLVPLALNITNTLERAAREAMGAAWDGVKVGNFGLGGAFSFFFSHHITTMEGGIMKMRPLPELDLPAGQPVTLKPGAMHIMLLGLTGPLITMLLTPPPGVNTEFTRKSEYESSTPAARVRSMTAAPRV